MVYTMQSKWFRTGTKAKQNLQTASLHERETDSTIVESKPKQTPHVGPLLTS